MESLVKKTALVTGASSGIGLATVVELKNAALDVAGVGRDFSNVDVAFEKIHCDLGNLSLLTESLPQFPKEVGALVLNAGVGQFGGLEQFSHSQIKRLIDTNLVSSVFIIKHYLPLLKKQGGGDIVIVGSESALQGARHGAVYCATKFALRGLAQSLRADCSTSNIRVHLINPGPVDTAFFDTLSFEPQAGQEFVLTAQDIAYAIINALSQARHVVSEEVNLQPMKRSFSKK